MLPFFLPFTRYFCEIYTHTTLRHTLYLITTLNLSLNAHALQRYCINSLLGAHTGSNYVTRAKLHGVFLVSFQETRHCQC
jgi:hypothetical protein